MHPLPYGEEIVIGHRTPRIVDGELQYDEYGVLLYDAVETAVPGCAVWPLVSTEHRYNEERTNLQYTVALPPGASVEAVDYALWQGVKYEVNGQPELYRRHPLTGSLGPIMLTIARAEG